MSGFASTKDLADKNISFEELGPGLYGYTAEGDPNSGVVIGDDSVLVVDAQATPYDPTSLRSTGVGWSLGIGRFGSIAGPVIGGARLQHHGLRASPTRRNRCAHG
jgi:hypothetical protein